jgi:NAD(P)-dependent dehydrogenase (short-subunit alcohol dehydrogenase family)
MMEGYYHNEGLMRLEEKVAIITGAGSGIGRATAIRFAAEGASVVVDDIDEARGLETVSEITEAGGQAIFVQADVTQEKEVARLLEMTIKTFGRPQILINAAICAQLVLQKNRWQEIVEIGMQATWLTMQAVIPHMRATGGGSIVNISSVNALMGFGNEHVYSGVKAGVIGMSRSLCGEVGKDAIRINCICPGTIITEIWQATLAKDPDIVNRLSSLYPLGRLGKPEEIANAALFLASDESSFATGAVFVIDGGITAVQLGFQL